MCPFTFFARFQEHLRNLFQVIERVYDLNHYDNVQTAVTGKAVKSEL